jgi:hypothetical protein
MYPPIYPTLLFSFLPVYALQASQLTLLLHTLSPHSGTRLPAAPGLSAFPRRFSPLQCSPTSVGRHQDTDNLFYDRGSVAIFGNYVQTQWRTVHTNAIIKGVFGRNVVRKQLWIVCQPVTIICEQIIICVWLQDIMQYHIRKVNPYHIKLGYRTLKITKLLISIWPHLN